MPGKILVPLDGTAVAEQIVPFVAEFARAGGFAVTLLEVIDPRSFQLTEPTLAMQDLDSGVVWVPRVESPEDLSEEAVQALSQANTTAAAYLSGIQKQLESLDVGTETLLGFGDPDVEIAEQAVLCGATMIAMASRSKSFWERGFLGTVTDRVIRASTMPVIVFKPVDSKAVISAKPETIVLGIDGSEESERALEPVAALAGQIKAKIVLVHVVSQDSPKLRMLAVTYLENLARKIGGDETAVLSGDSEEEIISYADSFNRPMIALAEHGGFSIARWFRGSTTDKVLRDASCPVLVIPTERAR